ncbi:MAG: hypothetical protein GY711_17585 [bacterium]|nr:hypothetical protein [bacterium]
MIRPAVSAILFVFPAAAAFGQCELSRTELDANDLFSLSLSGDRYLAGNKMFVRTGFEFELEAELASSGPSALDGEWAVVGNKVFRRPTWVETQTLDVGGTEVISASIDFDTIVLGLRFDVSTPGEARVFRRSGLTWSLESVLTPSSMNGLAYGADTSVSGDWCVVGAPFDGMSGAGYIYRRVGTAWTESDRLEVPNPMLFDEFGSTVEIEDDVMIIARRFPGETYVYENSGPDWILQQVIFGSAGIGTSISGNFLALGNTTDDTMGQNAGVAKVYVRDVSGWIERLEIFSSTPAIFDNFGATVQLAGTAMLITSPGVGSTGTLFVFSVLPFPQEDCNGNGELDACDILTGRSLDVNGNNVPDECQPIGTTYCPATDNSTGGPATLFVGGSLTASNNALSLTTTGLPPGRFGFYMASMAQDFVPLFGGSQGNLCLGFPMLRLDDDIFVADDSGQIVFQPNLTSLPMGTVVQSGDTWNWQYWFRDVNPGRTSNTSDGVEVTFL